MLQGMLPEMSTEVRQKLKVDIVKVDHIKL